MMTEQYKSQIQTHPNFVAPNGASVLIPQFEQSFQRNVLNPLLQNVWAGVGMALLVKFFPQLWDISYEDKTAIIWGITIFSILCLFRFSKDEIAGILLTLTTKLYDIKLARNNDATVNYYEGRIEQLQSYIKELTAQLQTLGGININNPLTEQEIADRKILALKLYNRAIANLPITRDECVRIKVFESRTQWSSAKQFLVEAGILEPSGRMLPQGVTSGATLIESYAQNLVSTRLRK